MKIILTTMPNQIIATNNGGRPTTIKNKNEAMITETMRREIDRRDENHPHTQTPSLIN